MSRFVKVYQAFLIKTKGNQYKPNKDNTFHLERKLLDTFKRSHNKGKHKESQRNLY